MSEAAAPSTVDVSDETFERIVLEGSRQRPVVVDFWAPWCGPCRTLGPLLERLAEESQGAFLLAKLDIDQNPRTASGFGIQSIPFVMAFRDGEIASEFVGAQPEHVVRQFLERVLPGEADRLAAEAEQLASTGDTAQAEERFRAALAKRAGLARASLGLARLLARSDRAAEAQALVDATSAQGDLGKELERLAAELRLQGDETSASADEASLRARVGENPNDLQAQLDLGRLLAGAGRYADAFEVLLDVVRRDPAFSDAAARKAILDLFTLLGREDPLVERYQRELALVLYR